jgi:hypothetical protein
MRRNREWIVLRSVRRVEPRHAGDRKTYAVLITIPDLRICVSAQLIWQLTFDQKLSNVLPRSPTAAARGRVPAGHAIKGRGVTALACQLPFLASVFAPGQEALIPSARRAGSRPEGDAVSPVSPPVQ